jgi:photosystem II stability/assembly factor-like uncharacterized protein
VYATSASLSGGTAKFLASTDSGVTWTSTALELPSATEPRILAVDPADEKKVYLRIFGATTDEIRMTSDGGRTFETILPPIAGQMSSFLRASDGTLYAGTRSGKLYTRAATASEFTVRDAPHLRCLGQRFGTARIYGCGDMLVDGYSLGVSDDKGATFRPVMSLTQLLGPLTCAPVETNCQSHWERIQGVLGIAKTDGGQGGSTKPSGGSSCASADAAPWSLWLLFAFTRRKRPRS